MRASDLLRDAIQSCGYSLNKISCASGVSQPALHRFMRGGGISLATAEKLFTFFGFETVAPPTPLMAVQDQSQCEDAATHP